MRFTARRQLGPRVPDGTRRVDAEEGGHDDRAGNAPLTHGVDHEELDVRQEEAEAAPDQRAGESQQAPRTAGGERSRKEDDVAGDPERGNIGTEQMRVLAVGDGL